MKARGILCILRRADRRVRVEAVVGTAGGRLRRVRAHDLLREGVGAHGRAHGVT